MNVIQCIIVDDEPMALHLIEGYIQKTPFLQLQHSFTNAFEALDFIKVHRDVDLIFLDIQMPDLTGIELSRIIPSHIKIIFTTAFDKYAIESYKVSAIDYLLKPFDYTEFLTAADKASQWISLQKRNTDINIERDFIFVKSEYRQVKVFLKDILYIESMKDYSKIFTTHNTTPILVLKSLKKFEEELPAKLFMRIHRSYIIALHKIDVIERNQVIINNHRITIAEQYKPDFEIFINNMIV